MARSVLLIIKQEATKAGQKAGVNNPQLADFLTDLGASQVVSYRNNQEVDALFPAGNEARVTGAVSSFLKQHRIGGVGFKCA